MKCFWDDRQRAHVPASEFFNGAMHPAAEHEGRVEAILKAIGSTQAPGDLGLDPLLRVHSQDYLDFLRMAHDQWLAAGREGDALPYTFPVVKRRPLKLQRIDALLGQYSFDTSTPIGPGTWEASYWAAQTALAATNSVLGGERTAFAFCRPPGHHCGADYLGGYSYLSNAAIAAEHAVAAGRKRVAILDVDYHHGNGTQDIFYERGDVLYVSIHADPVMDYPYYWGHADERGQGTGEGANLNFPLPRGTEWSSYEGALAMAVEAIGRHAPDLLIVSYGADTYEGDPISYFKLRTTDYAPMARTIAKLGLPTVVVMEGGYAVDALGANVSEFLSRF
ncbi:histone deacetylase family protein [Sphingomonas sp. SM33]|uniref:Histone deacetylase family protein n=1 Tax=Sphingomonas telluris TaxID=2907998 RepID=A0ABS9VPY7_9SPHN|nr:histone deacetylase family protein [Sphingomonas telluris]MCH8617045.1 histone deacetylase family protein [Sphingomonas telluris]